MHWFTCDVSTHSNVRGGHFQCSSSHRKEATYIKTLVSVCNHSSCTGNFSFRALRIPLCVTHYSTLPYQIPKFPWSATYHVLHSIHIFVVWMAGIGSRDASRCQYTCTTNPGKCHLSVTDLSSNLIHHVQVVTTVQCRSCSWEGRMMQSLETGTLWLREGTLTKEQAL
jgi:hypothetical protein